MNFFRSTTIRTRLVRSLILAVGVVAAVVVSVWSLTVEPALRMGVARQQKEIAQRAAGEIGEFIEHRVHEIIAVGEIGRFWQMRPEEQKQMLYRLMKIDPQIREVSVANRAGQETLRLSRLRVYTNADLRSLDQEEKFRQTIKNKIYIGTVYHDTTAEPFITLAVPVRFTPTQIRGVIAAEVSLKTLLGSVSRVKAGKSGYLFVVDQKGDLIAHPDYSKVLLGLNLSHVREVREFLENVEPRANFAEIATGVDVRKVITTHAAVSRPNWAVIVEEPVETALSEVKQVERVALIILALTLGGVVGISYFFSERIARPVRELERGANLIAQGDLEQKLDIHTGDELESLAHQFNQMAQALNDSYQGLEDKIAERTRDLSALYGALSPLSVAGNDELLQKIVERLKDATHADAALVRVFDKEKKAFVYPAHVGFPATFLDATRALREGSAVGEVFLTGEPIITANIAEDPRVRAKRQLEAGFKSCAFLPLRVAGELRGVIHLVSTKIGHFSEDKTDHLTMIARQMGIAMENRELFEEGKRRAKEQAALSAVAMTANQALQLDEFLDIVLAKVVEVTGRERVTIRLKDAVTGEVRLQAYRGFSQEEIETLLRMTQHRATDQVFASGQPVVTNDATKNAALLFVLPQSHAVAWVPIKARAKVVGVLGVSAGEPIAFEPRELELLQAIANVIGVALENARLFGETQKQNQQLQALYNVTSAVGGSLDIQRLLETALKTTIDVLRVDAGRLYILNEENQGLRIAAHYGLPVDQLPAYECYAPGEGIIGKIFQECRPVAFPDISMDPNYKSIARTGLGEKLGFRSAAGLPITVKDRPIGVIYVYGRAPRDFTPEEMGLLFVMGKQIGIALENARLFEKTHIKSRELEGLAAITKEITRLQKPDELLSLILEQAGRLLKAEGVGIRVVKGDELVCVARTKAAEDVMIQPRIKVGESLTGRVVSENRPIAVYDLASDSRHIPEHNRPAVTAGFRSFLGVPFRSRDKVIGTLNIYTKEQRHFCQEEIDLVSAFADQAAIAIENARLYEESHRREEIQKVLKELSQDITSLELDSLIRKLTEKVRELLSVDVADARVLEGRKWQVKGISGIDPGAFPDFQTGSHRGRLGWILKNRRPLSIPDITQDEQTPPGETLKALGIRGYLGVPLFAGSGEVVGVLRALTYHPREFTHEELDLLQQFANGAAIALENARLFEDTQHNLERIQALREIDQAITSTLDLRTVLDVLMEKIDLVLPYSATTVRLFNQKSGLLEPMACRNLDEAEWKSGQGKAGRGLANTVLEAKIPITVKNAQTDPRVEDPEFYRKHKLTSYLGVPLIGKEEVLGVLGFYTREEREFSKEETDFLSTLAGQAAIAIQNSGLYEQLKKQAADLERANKGKDEFLSVMSHELRTPLNVIMGYTGMLQDKLLGELNDEQHRALTVILNHSRDLLALITTILHATAIQADAAQVKNTEVDLSQFLTGIKAMYDSALRKELAFHWDFSLDLPVVKSDEDKLRHILQNLINNAVKFTEKGNVTVSAQVKECGRPARDNGSCDSVGEPGAFERRVEFSVADTGIGIAKEKLPVIFEMFRQVDSSDTRHYEGVGLGLYIVKKYTELLGGTVDVESEPGRGTVFTVAVPCSLSPREDTRRRERLGYEEGDGFSSRPT